MSLPWPPAGLGPGDKASRARNPFGLMVQSVGSPSVVTQLQILPLLLAATGHIYCDVECFCDLCHLPPPGEALECSDARSAHAWTAACLADVYWSGW